MNKDFNVIDLTHTISEDIPFWNVKSSFKLDIETDYKDCLPPDLFRTQKINCALGVGTHIDAPAHAALGGRTVDALTLSELIVDCVVIDVSAEVDENYIIMPKVIEVFEQGHGVIPSNSLVIFYTGWSARWDTPEKYQNNYIFPSVHISTAELLLARKIAGLGIDTFSADTGADGFPVHRTILGADKYLIENIANANLLPATGAKALVMPSKIKDATEAPVRLIALI